MEKSKIDRFVDAFRAAMYHEFHVNEEGMVANPPGGSGGFVGAAFVLVVLFVVLHWCFSWCFTGASGACLVLLVLILVLHW